MIAIDLESEVHSWFILGNKQMGLVWENLESTYQKPLCGPQDASTAVEMGDEIQYMSLLSDVYWEKYPFRFCIYEMDLEIDVICRNEIWSSDNSTKMMPWCFQ